MDPAGYVRAGDARESELPGYVVEADGYGIAQVALRQGTEVLSTYRGLYLGTTDTTMPGDPCIK